MLKTITLNLLALLAVAMPALSQDKDGYKATTTTLEGAEKVDLAVLKKAIKPLTQEEMLAEAEAWLGVLVAKNKEIAGNTGDTSAQIIEQSTIVTRLETVTKALTARGGDAVKFDQYVAASTGPDLSDASGMVNYVTEWVTNPEGGIAMAVNIGLFLLTLLAFKIISSIIASIVRKALSRMKNTSDLLRDFFVNVTRRIVFFIGLIVALSMLGIDITPFVAALGAAGFVIGFALQGTLSNFASGLMILLYRPYDVGQVVTVAGTTGTVDAMTLVSTTLKLPDNQRVVIPNNSIWGDVITNITGQSTRRVDMVFGCGYGDDLQKAQSVLESIVKGHDKVLQDPEPVIKVHELADSSVNFVVRPWSNTSDYWDVYWDITRQVKERFDAEGLNIPFPQQEVHMHQLKD